MWPLRGIGGKLQRMEKAVFNIWKLLWTRKTAMLNKETSARKRNRSTLIVWWALALWCWWGFFYPISSPGKWLLIQRQMFPLFLYICCKVQHPGPNSLSFMCLCLQPGGGDSQLKPGQLHSSICFRRFIGISSSCPTDGFPKPTEPKTHNKRTNPTLIHKQTWQH